MPLDRLPISKELSERFLQFSRNGRWGTCAGCPRDGHGHILPELCSYTERYDHNLNVDSLAEQFNRYKSGAA